jgi:DNA-directed RNA polymerase specialized sigma24 family protein
MSAAEAMLPERDRRVVQGVLAKNSFAAIAHELGISEGYAKVLAHRARKALREHFTTLGIDINDF